MLKNKLKIITHIGASSFSVAALAETHHPTDTDFNRFAFIVYGVDVPEFSEVISELYENCLSDNYMQYDERVIRTMKDSDTIRITRSGDLVNISRGNLKIIYSGLIGDLKQVADKLLKDYKQNEKE